MILIFNATKLPRSMGRAKWRELDRWRRVVQKRLAADVERQIEALTVFGTTHPELKLRALDRIINPPAIVVPDGGYPRGFRPHGDGA